MSNLLNIKDQSGNWIPIPVVTNGIKSITQNEDYTLTITLNDGTTYTTTSIKGEDGQDYILTEQDKQDIAGLVDTPVDDVRINGQSIVESGVANIPYGSNDNYGLLKASSTNGIFASGGVLSINNASESDIKGGTEELKPLTPNREHMATFYGLAKASGDSTQSQSDNPIGTYTNEAKASIKNMLGVEDVDIDSKAPVITETISGDIASFPDGADGIPLKSCIVQVEPVQAGSGDPSPENVRPITGWTGCEVQRTGVNLFDSSTLLSGAYSDADFNIPSSSSAIYRSIKIFLKAGTYTLSTSVNVDVVRTLIDGGFSSSTYGNLRNHTFTSNTDGYVGLTVRRYDRGDWDSATTLQIESGSTETAYDPHKGQTYPITFPTEAGTVYGGTLDVTTGELVVDRAMVELPSDMSWATWGVNYQTSGITGFYIYRYNMPSTLDFSNIGKPVLTNLLAIKNYVWGGSVVGYNTNVSGASSNWYEIVSINNETASILSTDTKAEAVAKFKAFLASTPLNVLYELATPITYQLTPQEITSLLGTNNLWANTGDTEVEYRADTKLFIERLTAPDSADMIADSNITSGSYFMVGNDLYRATVNIASGASVIVGTNATKVSLAQALNEINA